MADPPLCRYCEPTDHPWLFEVRTCRAFRCRYHGPDRAAQGHARLATVNDAPDGAVIEAADWICVRSAFCNPSCSAYSPPASVDVENRR